MHFCFGNYGGQVIQDGTWGSLVSFLNGLQADHLVLELAHRPEEDLAALREIDERLKIGIGVIDIKVNHVETAEEVAARIEKAAGVLGGDRIEQPLMYLYLGSDYPGAWFHWCQRIRFSKPI